MVKDILNYGYKYIYKHQVKLSSFKTCTYNLTVNVLCKLYVY